MKKIILLLISMLVCLDAFSQTFEEILKKAKNHDAAAQCAVGLSYLKGLNVKRDEAKAVEWFQHSASLGYAFGQYNLAQCFCTGIGVSQNFKLGALWATKSAKQGFVDAQMLLGKLYLNGDGVEQNNNEAFRWFLRAAEQDEPSAQHMVAYCYNEGIGIAKNSVEEMKWLSKAAENGDVTSQMMMAQNADNDNDAFKWFLRAAELGNADAQYAVGTLFKNGKGVSSDYDKAILWYKKAIEQEYAWAYNDLAYLYFEGNGVLKNLEKAFELINKAIEIEPENPNFYDTKGEFYSVLGEKEKALELWNKILEINPSFIEENTSFVQYILQIKGVNVDSDIPQSMNINEQTFAVIIANENYRREESVPYANNDGEIFKNYCVNTLGIPEKNIKYIADASLNDLKYNLNWLKQVMEAYAGEAKAIFYYAGHGIPDEAQKTAYLLPVDGYGSDVSTGYKVDELYATLGKLPSKSVTVFLDACFSGSKRDGGMLASARGVAIKAKKSNPLGNMVVFSAAQGDETAYPYKEQRHGMFTYYLLKKLQETKGEATLGEISDYVTNEVRKQSIVINGKMQTPTLTSSPVVGDAWRNWKLK